MALIHSSTITNTHTKTDLLKKASEMSQIANYISEVDVELRRSLQRELGF